MKGLKGIIKIVGIIIVFLVFFRGVLYRYLVNYKKTGKRENVELLDKELIQIIDKEIGRNELNIKEIIGISNQITSRHLSFTFNKVSNNPNKIFKFKKANCIGYSSLFNSIGNYIIVNQDLTEKYEFIHLNGQLDIFGYNIHKLFDSPFFKNHDFNEINNKETGKKIYVDPSLNDYLMIESISSK